MSSPPPSMHRRPGLFLAISQRNNSKATTREVNLDVVSNAGHGANLLLRNLGPLLNLPYRTYGDRIYIYKSIYIYIPLTITLLIAT